MNVREPPGAQWKLLFRILLSTNAKNLPAAGKFKLFAPATQSKAAEQLLLGFPGPEVL